jgi:hypothetical protein
LIVSFLQNVELQHIRKQDICTKQLRLGGLGAGDQGAALGRGWGLPGSGERRRERRTWTCRRRGIGAWRRRERERALGSRSRERSEFRSSHDLVVSGVERSEFESAAELYGG